jgi:hypothetical protein
MTISKRKTAIETRVSKDELARRHRRQFEEWLAARAAEIAGLRPLGPLP